MSGRRESIKVEDPELYKTEICRQWMDNGKCRYGRKCQYAHGNEELRMISRHQKYKSKPCKNWTTNGVCPYGKRCTFAHPGRNEFVTGSLEGRSPILTPISDVPSSPSPLPSEDIDIELSSLNLDDKRLSEPTRRLPVFIKRVSLPVESHERH